MKSSGELNPEAPILEAVTVSKSFKGLVAVKDYHLKLQKGEILGIIGPNGAGKSTIFNLITGHVRPTSGQIFLNGIEISHMSPDGIAKMGIGRTFQNIRLFSSMTVLENVIAARQLHNPAGLVETLISLPSFTRHEVHLKSDAMQELALFNLAQHAFAPALSLSYGDQRRLEIARALALRPQILLLDEPMAGMNSTEDLQMADWIRQIRDKFNITIVIVEHNMPVVMGLCERLQVLNHGLVIAEGTPAQVRKDPRVIESYLGKGDTRA